MIAYNKLLPEDIEKTKMPQVAGLYHKDGGLGDHSIMAGTNLIGDMSSHTLNAKASPKRGHGNRIVDFST